MKDMDKKKGRLPPKPMSSSHWLIHFSLVVQRRVTPPTRKGINMETSLPFGLENL